jgi:hypothetical protein
MSSAAARMRKLRERRPSALAPVSPLDERIAGGQWGDYDSLAGFVFGDPPRDRESRQAELRRALLPEKPTAEPKPANPRPPGRPKLEPSPPIAPTSTDEGDKVADLEAALLAWVRDEGITLQGPDGGLTEPDAARLLGWSESTLRHKRYATAAPPHRVKPRVLYGIRPLAEWLASQDT